MCDTVSTSIIFGALSLLPGNRYIPLGLIPAALIVYTVNRQRPSHKLARVERAIEACEETFEVRKVELHEEPCGVDRQGASVARVFSSPSRPNANANSLKASKNCVKIHDTVVSASARSTQSTVIRRFESTAPSV
ncbi:hypothetical protein B0H14DRAFT_2557514 [Mycena olivaceomarginata]|nr:hypothetical protein B0H14DRAFT_2557514 [Mycena olivaceomarginata]